MIKGIEEGLVDFPALRNKGEEVLLCWKDGEDDISYWHTPTGILRMEAFAAVDHWKNIKIR